jgi:tripartite-type tricarboxylate transporter receptor subunit TctC
MRIGIFLLLIAGCVPAASAQGDAWPNRPLRFIVGPGPDIVARMFG